MLRDVVLDAKKGVCQDGEDAVGLQVADEFDDDVGGGAAGAPEDRVAEAGIELGGGDGAGGEEAGGWGQQGI